MTNNFSKKICAMIAVILAFSSSNLAFAQNVKVGNGNANQANQIKASSDVEKNAKSDEINKTKTINSNPSTQTKKTTKTENITDPDLQLSIEELRKKYPISLLDEKKKNYKSGQKINIDDYSEAEIKAAFLNADNNIYKNLVIKKACERLGWNYNSPSLTAIQKRLQFFIFSNHQIREYVNNYAPDDISFCLLDADPFGIEDRN